VGLILHVLTTTCGKKLRCNFSWNPGAGPGKHANSFQPHLHNPVLPVSRSARPRAFLSIGETLPLPLHVSSRSELHHLRAPLPTVLTSPTCFPTPGCGDECNEPRVVVVIPARYASLAFPVSHSSPWPANPWSNAFTNAPNKRKPSTASW